MSIIEAYWVGVLQRLQAEVEVFSRLVQHAGEQGRANELALANLLQAFVPRRFGVGTGLVIDKEDRYSKQTDIVLFEQTDEPLALAQATHLLHPIETVLACVEVKTTLRTHEIDDCLQKKAALLDLRPAREYKNGATHPAFIVLAYRAGVSPEAIRNRFAQAEERLRPDLLCVINAALVGGRLLLGAPDAPEFPTGLALLRDQDAEGAHVPATVGSDEMVEVRGNQTYPTVDRPEGRFLADRARALLLFVEGLVRALAALQGRDPPVVSDYLSSTTRELVWL